MSKDGDLEAGEGGANGEGERRDEGETREDEDSRQDGRTRREDGDRRNQGDNRPGGRRSIAFERSSIGGRTGSVADISGKGSSLTKSDMYSVGGTPKLVGSTGRYESQMGDFQPFVYQKGESHMPEQKKDRTWRHWAAFFFRGWLMSFLSERDAADRAPWRVKLGNILESQWMEIIMAVLLIVDVCVIIAELIIFDILCHIKPDTNEGLEHAEHALHYTSISILSVFCLDLLLTFIAFDFGMFRHIGYILDTIIIPTALVLELVLDDDIAGLLVLLRLWRLLRVGHAGYTLLHDVEKEMANVKIDRKFDEMEHYYVSELEERDARIDELELQVKSFKAEKAVLRLNARATDGDETGVARAATEDQGNDTGGACVATEDQGKKDN